MLYARIVTQTFVLRYLSLLTTNHAWSGEKLGKLNNNVVTCHSLHVVKAMNAVTKLK